MIPSSAPDPASNELLLSMEGKPSVTDAASDSIESTHTSTPEDESCSGLAEVQIRAVNFSLANSMQPSIPSDIRLIADSTEPDPPLENPDPSFDRDNPSRITRVLPLNSISPSQHTFAPYDPDAIRGQFDTGAGVSCTNLKYLLHGYKSSLSHKNECRY